MRHVHAVLGTAVAALWLATARSAHADPLDLPTALSQAAAASPALAASQARAQAARQRVAPAGAWSSPIIEFGAVNVPTSGRFDQDPMTMKMVALRQRVPLFGANRIARQSALAASDAEAASTEVTRFEVLGMAWESYAVAYYAGGLARLAEDHGSVMTQMIAAARARYESGSGRLEDVLRAEAEQARILADIASFRAEEAGARAELDALRGRQPGGSADSLASPPAPLVPTRPDPWLAAVVATHPRLREQQAQASRYRLSASAARRSAWPDLELSGSYGWREPLEGVVPQDDMYSVTVGLMLPIFTGSREQSEAAEMDAMARASDAERSSSELELRRQVATAYAEAAAAQRTVGLLADTVLATQRRAVEASWTAYRAGATDLWRVLEAAHTQYSEEIALARARQDLARAGSRMVSLTGRADLLGVTLPETRSER